MNCRRIQELIPLFVEDDVDSRREKLVSDHLKSCDICLLHASEFKESQAWLKSHVAPEFDAAYLERIGNEVWARIAERDKLSVRERIIRRFWSLQLPIAVGALLVLLAGIAFVLLRSGAKDGRSNDTAVASDRSDKNSDVPRDSAPREGHPAGPAFRSDRRRVAPPSRKVSDKTAHGAQPQASEMARIIAAPNPISSGFQGPGRVSDDSREPDQLRIYIQTSDPNIRIIWLVPTSDHGD